MTSAQEIFSEALELQKLGHLAESRSKLKTACQACPDNVNFQATYIQALLTDGLLDDAEAACHEALNSVRNGVFYFFLGSIFVNRRSYLSALAAFEAAEELGFEASPLFNNASFATGELGNVLEAENYSRRALSVNPRSQAALLNLSRAVSAQGRSSEALEISFYLNHVFINSNNDNIARKTSDQILDLIDSHLQSVGDNRRTLIYIFSRVPAIGHLTQEIPYLKTLFHGLFDEIVVIIPQISSTRKINQPVFDACMRGVRVVETTDQALLLLSNRNIGTIQRGNRTYLIWSYFKLFHEFMNHVMAGKPRRLLQLTNDERAEGEVLLSKMNIPNDAKIVVLHVRTPGYYNGDKNSEFRNIDVRSYYKVISYLTDLGYVVIRIGDSSMPRLPEFGSMVIDAPFHNEYKQNLELAAIDRCAFMIACNSGPCSLARSMGKPILVLNCPPCFCNLHTGHEILAFRRCYDVSGGGTPRPLSYAEILERGICDFLAQEDFDHAGIRMSPLGEDEIVEITKEMIASLEDPTKLSHGWQRQFATLSRVVHERSGRDPGRKMNDRDWFGYALPGASISARYCEFHGRFLFK